MKNKVIGLFLIIAVIVLIVFYFSSNIINKNEIMGLWVNEENEKVIEFNNDDTFTYYSIDMCGIYRLNTDGSLTLKDEKMGEHTFKWDNELAKKYENKTMLIIEYIFNWYADENFIYLNGEKLHR